MAKDFSEYKNIWVFTEQRQGKIENVALELLGEAYRLSRDISRESRVCAILIGDEISGLEKECFAYGADEVYVMSDPLLENYTTEGYAKVLTDAINEYKPEIVLFGATHIGRDLAPRVAARLNTGLTADCTRLDIDIDDYKKFLETETTGSTAGLDKPEYTGILKQTRPAFGGNLMATIITPNTRPQMSTVRPGVMKKIAKRENAEGIVRNIKIDLRQDDIHTRVLEIVKTAKERVSLTDAEIIVSGGLGVGGPEGFEFLQKFADQIGAVVGSSRAAVDAGWIDHSRQVGQTGTTVKPKIYIACGISGAIQHLAGMQNSDIIIAINKNENAPIFEVADYGIVGDLFKVIPKIMEEWK